MKWKEWNRNLKIRLVGEWLFGLFFWMLLPFMAIYFSETLGKATAGILLVVSQLLSVAANLVGGYLADTYGRKRMMVVSATVQTAAFCLFAYANSPWLESPVLTFIAFSLVGIMGSFYYPASAAMVADLVEEEKQNSVFAVFYTMINVNVVLGPILGAYFFFTSRFELLLVSALVNAAVTLVFWRYVEETLPAEQRTKRKRGGSWISFVTDQVRSYRVILQDKVFLLFIVAGILIAQTFTQIDLLVAVYIKETVPLQQLLSFTVNGEKLFSWIIAENGFLVALFTVYVTKIADRFNERNIFVASSVAYGIAMIIFGNTVAAWGLIFAMALFTMAEIMVVGIQNSFISKLAPEDTRGQYFAAASLRWSVGRTLAPLAIPMTEWIGYRMTFMSIAVLAFVSAGLYVYMYRLFGQKEAGVHQMASNE
ncbi:MDR family MFS transporter [Ectobacillus ponti]|uniref:MFS transporter n=1 Tax=Ectobacillus ponti TaxID=2961894 RepID=A0AA41X4P0_9BACI|nr:MFS transporter [Ectobacillus ponti]MCP8968879.1 MFS transporter [Ectobacillus ponti]